MTIALRHSTDCLAGAEQQLRRANNLLVQAGLEETTIAELKASLEAALESVQKRLQDQRDALRDAETERQRAEEAREAQNRERAASEAAEAAAAAAFLGPLVRMPTPTVDIVAAAKEEGITTRALLTAGHELGVRTYTLHGRRDTRYLGLPGLARFGGGWVEVGPARIP